MKQLSVMLKPASSLCNLRCRYCFYADVSSKRDKHGYGIMSMDTAKAAIAGIYKDLRDGDGITFAFQGGEPTLAGLDFFREFALEVSRQPVKAHVRWALQTNGILLDESWCAFLKQQGFLVGLSLDCGAALHNQNRLGSDGKGSFSRVMKSKRLLDSHGVDYNIMCVLTSEAARHPGKLWRFVMGEGIRFIQLIPCLAELDADKKSSWALTPGLFYSFYSGLFPLWRQEVLRGNYISVKLFDDIANLFVRGQVTACGLNGRCSPQYIIEADGGVYPCDFYVLDEYRLGSMTEMTLGEAFDKTTACDLWGSRRLPDICEGCRYRVACGGGCKRMESAMYLDGDSFCGYRAFLDERLDELLAVERILSRGY